MKNKFSKTFKCIANSSSTLIQYLLHLSSRKHHYIKKKTIWLTEIMKYDSMPSVCGCYF